MRTFHFGLGQGHLPERRTQKIARKHGAELVNYTEPRGEKRHWFNAENLGEPFDSRRAREVLGELRSAGIIKKNSTSAGNTLKNSRGRAGRRTLQSVRTSSRPRKNYAKKKQKKNSTKNPQTASQLYEDFHGKEPTQVSDTGIADSEFNNHGRLAQLGEAVSCYIGEGIELKMSDSKGVVGSEDLDEDEPGWLGRIMFDSEHPPQIASNPTGTQIFFVGGNQDIGSQLQKMEVDTSKELIDCGPCLVIEYETRKGFDDFRKITYFHGLGEKTGGFSGDNGANPRLIYNRIRKKLQLVGGTYTVKPDGISD